MNDIAEQYAYGRAFGRRVHRDQEVTSGRMEKWFFKGVSRPACGNSSGRVSVYRTCPDAKTDTRTGIQACPHTWHRNGIEMMDYFPSFFGLYLGDAEGNEA